MGGDGLWGKSTRARPLTRMGEAALTPDYRHCADADVDDRSALRADGDGDLRGRLLRLPAARASRHRDRQLLLPRDRADGSRYGPLWGAFAGALATALYAAGVALNHDLPTSELFTISAPVRLVNYIAIGALLGWFASHYRIANLELQILAQRDFLTGLPNTRAFELAIDRRLAAKEPFALLVGDVDAQAGEDRDEALRRVSDVLVRVLDANIDVARVGGDEFAVLAPCWSVEEAGQLAARLERVLCEDGSLVTFGWSAFPREGENALTLYRAADERLYARRILRQPRNAAIHAVSV